MNLITDTEISMLELNSQLSDFGLQPADWRLIRNTDDQIKIENKFESSFYFLGLTQKNGAKDYWKNIQLAGI